MVKNYYDIYLWKTNVKNLMLLKLDREATVAQL